jgi:hypothetical protein
LDLVGTSASGIYLTLYNEGDATQRDLPRVGPYDEVVVRGAGAVGERAGVGQVVAARGSNGDWLGVDAGQQREFATGPGGAARSHIRVSATDGDLLIRFFDDERRLVASVPDLGPFATVVVGTHDLRANQRILAVRLSRTAQWMLTDLAGEGLQGVLKDALTFVSRASLAAARTADRGVAQPPVQNAELPAAPADEPAPGAWVDRVPSVREIYISRPDVPRR